MDIAGAKALKERLGGKAVEEALPARADVPEDAPPVYHWTGVRQRDLAATDTEEVSADRSVSKFLRLGLGFR